MKKHSFKSLLSLAAAAALSLSLTACAGGTPAASPGAPAASAPEPAASAPGGETKRIGVVQFATHASLDDCYNGLMQGLEAAGYVEGKNLTIDHQNAQTDMSSSDLMAKNMVASGYDLIVGIATPSAMSAYAACRDTDIPVVFTAVSNPIAAQIVQSMEAPGVNCTGTADILDLEAQVKMIRAFLPDATKIGIIYTTSEPNSVSDLERIQGIAPDHGFEIVAQGVTSGAEVGTAAATLVAKGVDCINNFTDNTVVENMSQMLHATDEAGIPIFGSEIQQVVNGCLASESIDYVALGVRTGEIAAQILSGEGEAAAIAVNTTSETSPVINTEVAQRLGISIPEDYAAALDVAGQA